MVNTSANPQVRTGIQLGWPRDYTHLHVKYIILFRDGSASSFKLQASSFKLQASSFKFLTSNLQYHYCPEDRFWTGF